MPKKIVDGEVKLIRVRARKMGYFEEQRRRIGDIFDIPENLCPTTEEGWKDSWMERVKAGTPKTIPGSIPALERQINQQRAYQDTQNESESAEVI